MNDFLPTHRPLSPWGWLVPSIALVLLMLVWASGINESLFLGLNRITTHTGGGLWANITTFGDTLAIFSMLLLLVMRRPDLIWQVIMAAMVSTLFVHGLKEWLLVMRPPYYFGPEEINIVGRRMIAVSFPSGHTTAVFTIAGIVAQQMGVATRWKIALILSSMLIGFSRIAVGAHWPMDVLAGVVIGYTSAVAGVWLAGLIPWGLSRGAQRIFAVVMVGAAINLALFHESGYEESRLLEITIAVVCLLLALPRLRQLFTRTEEERRLAQERREAVSGENQRQSLLGLAIRISVTIIIFGLILRGVDFESVMDSFQNLVPRLLLLGIIFQILSTLLASYRWYLVMKPLGFGERFPFYMKSYFKGSFFNQGLPTSIGGDAIRVIDASRLGFRKREAFYGVFIDRVLGLVGLLILNLIANALNPDLLPSGIFLTINLLVAGGLVGFIVLFFLKDISLLERWTVTRLFHHISGKLRIVMADWRLASVQVGLSLGVHLLTMIAIFLIGRSVEMPFDLLTFMVIVPPVILLTLVPISLAGWGVREGAMIGLFGLIGADKISVLSMSILYGIVLIIASLPGLQVYLTGKHRI